MPQGQPNPMMNPAQVSLKFDSKEKIFTINFFAHLEI